MSEFKRGEIVDITIKGATVVSHNTTTDLLVIAVVDAESTIDLSGNTTVELVAPAQWPPRPGDVWRDRTGEPWFAFRDVDLLLVPSYPVKSSRGGLEPYRVLTELSPLTLVHREGNQHPVVFEGPMAGLDEQGEVPL